MLSLALLIIGLDNTILAVALPSLQQQLDADSSQLQWINDSYLLVFAGLLLSFGVLGDRFGRKLALQAGTAVFGLASLCVLFVDTADQLIVVRALMGAGGALIMPATLSIISNVFPREERAKAIAVWSAAASIGIGFGPLFGGLLLEWFDWQSVFLLNVPVCVLVFALAIRLVPNSRDPEPGRFDLAGATLSAGALLFLVYGIIEAPVRGWLDPFTLGSAALASTLGLAFLWWEHRTPEPMLDLRLFRRSALRARRGRCQPGVLRADGHDVLADAVPPVRARLLAARGRSRDDADRARHGARRRQRPRARPASRHEQGRRRGADGARRRRCCPHSTWSPSMPYWPIAVWFLALAVSIGWIMGPATNAVMGAVPESKAGVGSAMNDVTRQVAGALGVAVIGSLTTSLYTSTMERESGGSARRSGCDGAGQRRRSGRRRRRHSGEAGTSLAERAAARVHRCDGARSRRRSGRRVRRRAARHPVHARAGQRAAAARAAAAPGRRGDRGCSSRSLSTSRPVGEAGPG